jgi:hypothetical protein
LTSFQLRERLEHRISRLDLETTPAALMRQRHLDQPQHA